MVWNPNPGPAQVRRPFSLGKWIERLFIFVGVSCTILSAAVFVWLWTGGDEPPTARTAPQEEARPAPRRQAAPVRTEPAQASRPRTPPAASVPLPPDSGTLYTVVSDVPLRRLPDPLSRAKRVLRKDEQVEKVGSVKGWMRVRTRDPDSSADTVGWVRADQLRSQQ